MTAKIHYILKFKVVPKWTETIDPKKLSNKVNNSLENNLQWIKKNRLDWEMRSIKEAESWLTQNGKEIKWRILIGIDNGGKLVIEDGRHLLEAYRRLDKEIPISKIWFRSKKAESLFNNSF